MKTIKKMRHIFLLFALFIVSEPAVNAQKKNKEIPTTIKNLLDGQRYRFNALYVTPANGRQRFLTGGYILSVSKDTVISDLPYFGRAYSAPIGGIDGGIKFTSVDFQYSVVEKKNGGREITIKPKDARDIQQLILTVYNNGTAYLFVNSNNRQSISFNGNIQSPKTK